MSFLSEKKTIEKVYNLLYSIIIDHLFGMTASQKVAVYKSVNSDIIR